MQRMQRGGGAGGAGGFRSICTTVSQRQHPYLTATSSALLYSDNYTVMKAVGQKDDHSYFRNAPGRC